MTARRPVLALAGDDLETLELMSVGMLGLADGYRLPDDAPEGWMLLPRLKVNASLADAAVKVGELELRDLDTTPLAVLTIDASTPASDGGWTWLAGRIKPLRRYEHGPARQQRITPDVNLTEHLVGVFAGEVRPSDVLRLIRMASGRPIAFVVDGAADPAKAGRLVGLLQDCAEQLPDTSIFFIPRTSVNGTAGVDVTRLVLEHAGARDLVDLRLPTAHVNHRGAVVLFTGLSGAGKSTIARAVTEHLRSHTEQRVVLLDGDHVRAELASELTFSAEDRDRNLLRQAWVGARVAEAGGLAICAPIAPFASSRAAMRAKVEPKFRFLLVYVSTPIAVAEERDRKGLYAKARAGLIADFTGIDSPYEEPEDADLSIDTSVLTVDQCVDEVVALLKSRRILPEPATEGT